MGSKKQPTAPTPVDPREVARADAEFNRIDQNTPFGSLSFSGPNRNVANLDLSDNQQQIFDQREQIDNASLANALGRLGNLNNNPISTNGLPSQISSLDTSGVSTPNLQGGIGPTGGIPNAQLAQGLNPGNLPGLNELDLQGSIDTSGLQSLPNTNNLRGRVEQASFDRARGLLDPVFQQQERSLRGRLANQGLPQGDEAFTNELSRFESGRNEALTNAANNAVLAGGQESSRELSNALAARGQGFGEQLAGLNANNQAQLGNLSANQSNRGQLFGEALQGGNFQNQSALAQFGADTTSRQLGIDDRLRERSLNNEQQSGLFNVGQQLLQNQLTNANLNNAARQTGFNEQQIVRGNQFNELASLLGLQQTNTPQLSGFFGPGQADVTGGFALNQQQQNANFQAAQQGQQSALGGLFGLGGALLGGAGAAGGFGSLFGGGGA